MNSSATAPVAEKWTWQPNFVSTLIVSLIAVAVTIALNERFGATVRRAFVWLREYSMGSGPSKERRMRAAFAVRLMTRDFLDAAVPDEGLVRASPRYRAMVTRAAIDRFRKWQPLPYGMAPFVEVCVRVDPAPFGEFVADAFPHVYADAWHVLYHCDPLPRGHVKRAAMFDGIVKHCMDAWVYGDRVKFDAVKVLMKYLDDDPDLRAAFAARMPLRDRKLSRQAWDVLCSMETVDSPSFLESLARAFVRCRGVPDDDVKAVYERYADAMRPWLESVFPIARGSPELWDALGTPTSTEFYERLFHETGGECDETRLRPLLLRGLSRVRLLDPTLPVYDIMRVMGVEAIFFVAEAVVQAVAEHADIAAVVPLPLYGAPGHYDAVDIDAWQHGIGQQHPYTGRGDRRRLQEAVNHVCAAMDADEGDRRALDVILRVLTTGVHGVRPVVRLERPPQEFA